MSIVGRRRALALALALAASALLTSCERAPDVPRAPTAGPRTIIGGTRIRGGSWATGALVWMGTTEATRASVRTVCTATLVSLTGRPCVITAAHCMEGKLGLPDWFVLDPDPFEHGRTRGAYLKMKQGVKRLDAEDFAVPNYRVGGKANEPFTDVAFVRLKAPDAAQPLSLQATDMRAERFSWNYLTVGDKANTYGFGDGKEEDPTYSELGFLRLAKIAYVRPFARFQFRQTAYEISYLDGAQGAFGDSGGPIWKDGNGISGIYASLQELSDGQGKRVTHYAASVAENRAWLEKNLAAFCQGGPGIRVEARNGDGWPGDASIDAIEITPRGARERLHCTREPGASCESEALRRGDRITLTASETPGMRFQSWGSPNRTCRCVETSGRSCTIVVNPCDSSGGSSHCTAYYRPDAGFPAAAR